MTKLVVLYGNPTHPTEFDDYFIKTHLPLVERMPRVRGVDHGHVRSLDGSAPPYFLSVQVVFDSLDDLEAATASAEGQAAAADVANFATGGATIFVQDASPKGTTR
ncbi:EthD family reductase [Mycolicibacterium goodii]|uniref:Ethyl tert-butyl ether degradation protein EthD n=1 Tax=Mycolicibacterium goodii TaxID=134601 RepID=A0A0K0XA98_MYCGD|nr:ethyl tert-butyl ether degradation protein EthD [Mycolicibacterium goodii]